MVCLPVLTWLVDCAVIRTRQEGVESYPSISLKKMVIPCKHDMIGRRNNIDEEDLRHCSIFSLEQEPV
jgi:hypothetical protein